MRVLFVTHSYPRTEDDVAGAFILRLAVALKAAGTEVTVAAPSAPDLAPSDTLSGVPVRRFRYAIRSWETLAYEGTMAEQVSAGFKGKAALVGLMAGARSSIRKLIAEFQPDVVHAHWWFPSGLAASYTPGATPLVVTMHGSDVRLAMKSAFAPALFRRVAKRAAAMTAVSKWLASNAQQLGAPGDIVVAPMPVDVARFEPNSGNRSPSVLFVGRLNAQKGAADLLKAADAFPAGTVLDMVGDGPDRAALETEARSHGLEGRVRWHGQLPQSAIVSLYRQASVVAMPSRDEGLGLVAVEALLTGTPVVAYRSGGVAELIEDGVTGILAEAGNTGALGGSISALLADPARARRMGAEGRARMVERFSPATAAAAYSAIYARVART
jgi:glycosyltransferase involved in cell wall biosynthesis